MLHNIYGRIWTHFSSIRGGLLLFVGLLSGLSSCSWGTNLPGKYRLMEGDWRGALLTEGGELPFLFGLDRTGDSTFRFELIDGRDTLRTEELQVVGDSLIVRFPVFESVLIAGISQGGDSLVGRLVKVKNDVESSIPCTATRGGKYKFAARVSRLPDEVGGIWATTFYKANPLSVALAKRAALFRVRSARLLATTATSMASWMVIRCFSRVSMARGLI
jgi:hypothetical protein